MEIVRNCQYETASRDDVIIQQGDHGDRWVEAYKNRKTYAETERSENSRQREIKRKYESEKGGK